MRMNIDQVYDELYGVIDKNKAADAATQDKVASLEGTVTTQGNEIVAIKAAIPEVLNQQLKLVDLGTEYTQDLKEDIYTGAFKKAVVGGYLTLNDHVYIFAHADYWLHKGDTECTDHHMLIVPADSLGQGAMNLTSTTTGGYVNSDMRAGHDDTTDPENPVHVDGALQSVIDIIKNDFGADNLLSHKLFLTNAVTNGAASSRTWVESEVDLMSEVMVFGNHAWGAAPGQEEGCDTTQIRLFAERPDLINIRQKSYWLRDVSSAAIFANVASYGHADRNNAGNSLHIRPAFAIKGAPPETRTKKRKG